MPSIIIEKTKILCAQLDQRKLEAVVDQFSKWKAIGPSGEFESYLFGKDGGYTNPKIDGGLQLRHAHFFPAGNPQKLAAWDAAWKDRSTKLSDKALVYAQDGNKFLLIAMLQKAHSVASMKDPAHAAQMKKYARIADDFIYQGKNDD